MNYSISKNQLIFPAVSLAMDSKVKIGEWITYIYYSSLLASRVKRNFILVFLLDHCLSCNFVPFDFNCQLTAYLSNMLCYFETIITILLVG